MVRDVISALGTIEQEVFTLPGQDEHIEFRVPVELLDVTGTQQISKDSNLGIPLQKLFVGSYVIRQRLTGRKRYPRGAHAGPLFRCNLVLCRLRQDRLPRPILHQNMSVEDALHAVDECGAPVVSIAGGEPLLHKQLPEIVRGIVARKKFVYLCTNALLMDKKLSQYEPSTFFTWSVHLDGDKEMHDHSVCQPGTYDRAVTAIKHAKERGFRVNINCTLFNTAQADRVAAFFDTAMELGVDGITVSPGYAYERAPDQQHFLNVGRPTAARFSGAGQARQRGRSVNRARSRLLAETSYHHAVGNPTRTIFGWRSLVICSVKAMRRPSMS
jgi:hopanoid biosynthesis associated radical SAM protein HpnH